MDSTSLPSVPHPNPITHDTIPCPPPVLDPAQAVVEHERLVYHFANRAIRLGARVELDDLVQEGRLGLLDAAEHWRADAGTPFGTFACYYVRGRISRAIQYERRRGMSARGKGKTERPTLGTIDDEEHPVHLSSTSNPEHEFARHESLRKAIDKLRPKTRAVILLLIEGSSAAEIAAALGLSVSAVNSHVHVAKKKLSKHSASRLEKLT